MVNTRFPATPLGPNQPEQPSYSWLPLQSVTFLSHPLKVLLVQNPTALLAPRCHPGLNLTVGSQVYQVATLGTLPSQDHGLDERRPVTSTLNLLPSPSPPPYSAPLTSQPPAVIRSLRTSSDPAVLSLPHHCPPPTPHFILCT